MFDLFKRSEPSIGTAYFRGNLPPRAEDFQSLNKAGVRLSPAPEDPACHWVLNAHHPSWGEARIACVKEPPAIKKFLMFSPQLTESELEAGASAGIGVTVTTPSKSKSVLKDRKRMLRFLDAIMGSEGVLAFDHHSTLIWSKASLIDELQHDAELDIQSVYALHAVTGDGHSEETPNVEWVHTHGLAELGTFDFDILRPHISWTTGQGMELIRAIAFGVVGKMIGRDEAGVLIGHPNLKVRMVPVKTFMEKASTSDRKLRHDPENAHGGDRSVVCEPAGRSLFGLRRQDIRINRALTRSISEQTMCLFSTAATELMAERARATIGLVPSILEELRLFDPQFVVKMGYPTDSKDPGSLEHLWFSVHDIRDDNLDATLLVQPFDISSMKVGERANRPISRLTDWTIGLPFGTITPRSFGALRFARENMASLSILMEAPKSDDSTV